MVFAAALLTAVLASGIVQAAHPFMNEPDTGLQTFLEANGTLPNPGELLPLQDTWSIPDFDYAARMYLPAANYSYYRTGAAGEYGYRSNLDTFNKVKIRPRVLMDVVGVQNTLSTTILGYNFSAPFFIAPAAQAGRGNVEAEVPLVQGAAAGGILYIPSLFATLNISQIAAAKAPGQVTFQQLYVRGTNKSLTRYLQEAEAAGSKAIVFSVDNAWLPARSRSARWGSSESAPDYDYPVHTWTLYDQIKELTTLPVIPKGIQSVADALLAIEHGAPAIYVSNHGARQLDTSQSTMEIILEMYDNAPQIFNQTEVLADCGVRYGTDVLKLLAMGVKAVGMGRPFMYANVYGVDGITRLINLMKQEIIADAGNMGIGNLSEINPSYLNLNTLRTFTNGFS